MSDHLYICRNNSAHEPFKNCLLLIEKTITHSVWVVLRKGQSLNFFWWQEDCCENFSLILPPMLLVVNPNVVVHKLPLVLTTAIYRMTLQIRLVKRLCWNISFLFYFSPIQSRSFHWSCLQYNTTNNWHNLEFGKLWELLKWFYCWTKTYCGATP